MSQFCGLFFFPPSCYALNLKSPDGKRLRLTDISALTHAHNTYTNVHISLHVFYFFIFFFVFLNHHTVSLITDKKPPDNHFFDKVFMGAFLPYHHPPIFKEPLVDFFDSSSVFRGREKRRSLPKALRMSFHFFFSVQLWRPWWRSVDVLISSLRLYFS